MSAMKMSFYVAGLMVRKRSRDHCPAEQRRANDRLAKREPFGLDNDDEDSAIEWRRRIAKPSAHTRDGGACKRGA
jgi:hypothetical protein